MGKAALNLAALSAAALLSAAPCWADADADTKAPDASGAPPPTPSPGFLSKWLNPTTAPFIPVPEIAVDPDSGTTLGLLAVWVKTDENHEIRRIIAPDVLHNPYFGYGFHARMYVYSSQDEQWSLVGGIKERVEREFDAEYQLGRLRAQRWSVNYSVISDRDGTPRFFGIGNKTREADETNFTNQQQLAQVQVGLNITHAWQLLYTARMQIVDVLPGHLDGVASIESRFSDVTGLGTSNAFLNRLSLVYDTRDDLTVPTRGVQWVAYGGAASRSGLLNDSMYSEAGADARAYWPIAANNILAVHMAVRYLPTTHDIPFWALSSLGGGESVVGGAQPLRGFGAGRFYDRDSFSSTVELRRTIMSFSAASTNVDLEFAPFIDLGRVFSHSGTFPLDQLHHVYGVGFRGIARPFVVGKVDIGYGSDGVAVFTGLNYPF